MSLQKVITEDRRLCILRLLCEQKDYSLNLNLMQKALYQIGHGAGYDVVQADVAWLNDIDLLTMEDIGRGITVAKLTRRGNDVATGRLTVPGIERPGPGD